MHFSAQQLWEHTTAAIIITTWQCLSESGSSNLCQTATAVKSPKKTNKPWFTCYLAVREETVRQMRACLDTEGSSLSVELTVKIHCPNIWHEWTKICQLEINDKLLHCRGSRVDSVGAQIELEGWWRTFLFLKIVINNDKVGVWVALKQV